MALTCSRCSRNNPANALFCYFDGAALGDLAHRQRVADPARQRFPMPFVFPSGKACHTFDELTLAILEQWKTAGSLLEHNVFTSFLAGLGRSDLSATAREAARFPDRDRGLDQLLSALPSSVLQPPKLLVEPSQINLGSVRAGHDGRFDVRLANQGMGLLHGTVECEECPWLSLGEPGAGVRKKMFQFLHEATLRVNVCGKSLRAGARPQQAQIIFNSIGGIATILITIEVPIQAFSEGVLAGATTPRQIAEKARKFPREAADLFARGTVAKWYALNGWTYPVNEPSASGIAAVQQFFEALGLTTPPKVGISVADIRLEGRQGDILRTSLQVVAQEKRPVYAHAVSNQPWLVVNEVALDGRTATIHLRVPEVPDRTGETLQARLTVTANGRQRFVVPVSLTVSGRNGAGGRPPSAPALGGSGGRPPQPPLDVMEVFPANDIPTDFVAEEPRVPPRLHAEDLEEVIPVVERLPEEPAPRRRRERPRHDDDPDYAPEPSRVGGRTVFAILPVVFLVIGLLVTLGRDAYTWVSRQAADEAGMQDNFGNVPQMLSLHFHDTEEHVQLAANGSVKPTVGRMNVQTAPAVWEPSMRFGLVLAQADTFGRRKKLTYEEKGLTNNTCIRLDGQEWLFGERPFRRLDGEPTTDRPWPGRWLDRDARPDRPLREGRKSIWIYDDQKVQVSQTVGLVPGEQSGKLDTCLILYRIDNQDSMAHNIGLRFLLDTFIGGNDGVPFLIPGRKQLCSTSLIFAGTRVPDFIQARETEDLTNPGTVAHIQLKIPGMEPPERVTLGAWPNPQLAEMNPALRGIVRQEKTLWEVPVLPIKTLTPADSAVVIYWAEKPLPAGASRELAFAYGLGNVSSSEGGGRLALTVGGSFLPNGEFTLTAYVSNPVAGQTVTLELPEGFALIGGAGTENVPALPRDAPRGTSPVSWKIRAGGREGKFPLRVRSSSGASQTQTVTIRARGIFG
jgi:hypothetical protein